MGVSQSRPIDENEPTYRLLKAIRDYKNTEIEELLKSGSEISGKRYISIHQLYGIEELSPLDVACVVGNLEALLIIENQMQADSNELDTASLLMYAILGNSTGLKRVSDNFTDLKNGGNLRVIKYLLNKLQNINTPITADTNLTPLSIAVMTNVQDKMEIIELLLQYNANPYYINENYKLKTEIKDHISGTAISVAISWFDLYPEGPDILSTLLGVQGSEQFLQRYGPCLINDALLHNQLGAIEILLEKGAHPNLESLHSAIMHGSLISKAGKMLSYNKDVGLIPIASMIIHAVEERGNVLEFSINTPDKDGYTVLHKAVILKNVELVRILMEAGANDNAKYQNLISPYAICVVELEKEDLGNDDREIFNEIMALLKPQTKMERKVLERYSLDKIQILAKFEEYEQRFIKIQEDNDRLKLEIHETKEQVVTISDDQQKMRAHQTKISLRVYNIEQKMEQLELNVIDLQNEVEDINKNIDNTPEIKEELALISQNKELHEFYLIAKRYISYGLIGVSAVKGGAEQAQDTPQILLGVAESKAATLAVAQPPVGIPLLIGIKLIEFGYSTNKNIQMHRVLELAQDPEQIARLASTCARHLTIKLQFEILEPYEPITLLEKAKSFKDVVQSKWNNFQTGTNPTPSEELAMQIVSAIFEGIKSGAIPKRGTDITNIDAVAEDFISFARRQGLTQRKLHNANDRLGRKCLTYDPETDEAVYELTSKTVRKMQQHEQALKAVGASIERKSQPLRWDITTYWNMKVIGKKLIKAKFHFINLDEFVRLATIPDQAPEVSTISHRRCVIM